MTPVIRLTGDTTDGCSLKKLPINEDERGPYFEAR